MPTVSLWKHGGVTYPVTESTTNTLLRDADPALHFAAELFTSALNTYVGPRLLAQAALEDINFPSAVEKVLHFEPTPFLLSDQMVFPLFCLYRTEEAWIEMNAAALRSASVWEWAYVLPPFTPRQIEQLSAILRSVAVVVSTVANQSCDPGYADGATLRDLSGIQKMQAQSVKYGGFEAVDGQLDKWWRAVTGRLLVMERDELAEGALKAYEGVSVDIDSVTHEGSAEEDIVQLDIGAAPVIEDVQPKAGTKQGGTLVEITGKNFRLGTTPLVMFGGAYASSVRVTHPRRITCLTPEYSAAQPSLAVDVRVIAADGQASAAFEDAFTFTAP